MILSRTVQKGFSAVELLITLFIGTLFIIAGNQLYIYVISSGEEANQRARASNIGYQYLQSESPTVNDPCDDTVSAQEFTDVPVDGLINVNITVSVSCPYKSLGSSDPEKPLKEITKITSLTKYGSDQKEVLHAIYKTP